MGAAQRMVFCSQCGRKGGPGAKFCEGCGTKLAAAAAGGSSPSRNFRPHERAHVSSSYNKPSPSYNKPSPSYNKPTPSYSKPSQSSYSKPSSSGNSYNKVNGNVRGASTDKPRGQVRNYKVGGSSQSSSQSTFTKPSEGVGGLPGPTYEKQPAWAYAEQEKNRTGQHKTGMWSQG